MYDLDKTIKEAFALLMSMPDVSRGLSFIEQDQTQAIQDQKAMVIIEAPTFGEAPRALDYSARLKALGLTNVHIDRHGNALATRPGQGAGPVILLEAHLDTVFPIGTDVTPVERDGKIFAPGICDDTRGLATVLSVVRAFNATGIATQGDIIFAGTVAEEGMGSMRGMQGLLADHPEIAAAISIDGGGCDSIIYQATGMRNYEVTYRGPGGHAYVAFGLPSPVHAAGRAIAKLSDLRPPADPKTTFTVSLVAGGHQIHAIAERAQFSINMRSDDQGELERLGAAALQCFAAGATEENERWGQQAVTVEYEVVLDVRAGTQPAQSPIVQAAWAATELVGVAPRLVAGGCTNSNAPISLGVPAVTLGRGGREGGIHSLAEWFDPTEAYRSPQKSFLLLLALAGVCGVTEPVMARVPS